MQVMSAEDVRRAQAGAGRSRATSSCATSSRRIAWLRSPTPLGAGVRARQRSSGELFKGGGTVSGHLNCFPGARSRFVYETIEERGIVDVARAVDPAKADGPRVTLNYNLPGSKAQFYHIDDLFTEAFMICNIAVVDTDLTQWRDRRAARNQQEASIGSGEYAVQRKYRLTTRVCLKQGDVILRMSTLWHRGMPNNTAVPRPMMSITFGEKSAPEGDPFWTNDGEVAFYPNWFTPSRSAASGSGPSWPCRGRTRPTASPDRCSATGATRPGRTRVSPPPSAVEPPVRECRRSRRVA